MSKVHLAPSPRVVPRVNTVNVIFIATPFSKEVTAFYATERTVKHVLLFQVILGGRWFEEVTIPFWAPLNNDIFRV